MPKSPPAPGLTTGQHDQLDRDGYIVVEQALSSAEVAHLSMAVDKLFARHAGTTRTQIPGGGTREDRSGSLANVVEKCDELLALLDHAVTFPLVLDLLGPYITLGLSEATRKTSSNHTAAHTGFIHTDGGHSLSRMWVDKKSRPLLVKTHYFLTDCSAPDMGNFAVVPGSHHRTPYWKPGDDTTPAEADAVPVLMKAGDCVMCDCVMWAHPLWHGAVPNHSAVIRKTVTFGYTQMFIRPLAEPPSERLLSRCTLRQRRLLGDLGPGGTDQTWRPQFGYFYAPADYADVMLGH